MNADKLAQALRAFPEDPNPFTYRRAYAKAQAALAEHDAQPAQAAQPVGVPAGWMFEELDGGFVHVESPQTLAVNLGYYPEGNATASQLLRLLACALLAPQPPAQPSADAVSIAAEISTRPEFAKYEAPLILDIVRETLKAARAAEGGKS